MCSMHNAIFRGFNSIYQQAPYVADADKSSFIGYCLTWYKVLKFHTENEDKSLFPRTEELLNDDQVWERMHEEHDAFQPGLRKFQEYLSNLGSPLDFSGYKIREIMTSFQSSFETHFRNEIGVIANLAGHPRTPKAGSSEEKSTQADFDGREGKAIMMAGITDVLPFVLFHMDWDYEEGIWTNWPPIPLPVRWAIMSTSKLLHSDWWKFACCDSNGKRKELHALPPVGNQSKV